MPQESVLSPILFNIYTNGQALHGGTHSFIYADNLCITAHYSSFTEVESTIGDALTKLRQYYRSNSLRANPDKTQVTAFHLRNKESKLSLKVVWNKTELENTPHPKYLGVTLDRTSGYKQHNYTQHKDEGGHTQQSIKKVVKFKMGSECRYNQNNSIGIKILCGRIRGTCLGEITSRPETVYGTKQCMQSRHRMPETNQCRRSVFASWSCATRHPIDVCARIEKTKQETNEAHSLYGQHSAADRRLKCRNCFLRSVKPAELSSKIIRCNEWLRRLQTTPQKVTVNLSEGLAR